MTQTRLCGQTPHLSCRVVDDLLGGEIALVADEQLVHVVASVTVDLLQPLLHVIEGVLVCAIVNYNNSMCAPIVAGGYRSEPFLSRGVPL